MNNILQIKEKLAEVFQSGEEKARWLREKVHQAGTHVMLVLKLHLVLKIYDDPYLRVQVSSIFY